MFFLKYNNTDTQHVLQTCLSNAPLFEFLFYSPNLFKVFKLITAYRCMNIYQRILYIQNPTIINFIGLYLRTYCMRLHIFIDVAVFILYIFLKSSKSCGIIAQRECPIALTPIMFRSQVVILMHVILVILNSSRIIKLPTSFAKLFDYSPS